MTYIPQRIYLYWINTANNNLLYLCISVFVHLKTLRGHNFYIFAQSIFLAKTSGSQFSRGPICRTNIFQGPNLPGPDLPGPNLPPRGPICRGPICRGPICHHQIFRGPICRTQNFLGPNLPGPNLPGPNLPGPNLPGPNLPGPNLPRTLETLGQKDTRSPLAIISIRSFYHRHSSPSDPGTFLEEGILGALLQFYHLHLLLQCFASSIS